MGNQLILKDPAEISENAKKIISSDLREDIKTLGIDKSQDKEFDMVIFKDIKNEVIGKLKEIDSVRKNPYHNAEHAIEVLGRARKLMEKIILPLSRRQIVELSALFHDYDHCGRTHRFEPDGLSNEEYACLHADKYAKSIGFSVHQRILVQGLIIGTTFGNPQIGPKTELEKLLAIADVGGFEKSFEKWIEDSANVLKEVPIEKRPASAVEWLNNALNFINWIKERITPEAQKYWGKGLEEKEKIISQLIQSPEGENMNIINSKVLPLISSKNAS
jgi:hypothetical protein